MYLALLLFSSFFISWFFSQALYLPSDWTPICLTFFCIATTWCLLLLLLSLLSLLLLLLFPADQLYVDFTCSLRSGRNQQIRVPRTVSLFLHMHQVSEDFSYSQKCSLFKQLCLQFQIQLFHTVNQSLVILDPLVECMRFSDSRVCWFLSQWDSWLSMNKSWFTLRWFFTHS